MLILPLGDFGSVSNISDMYYHCKTTEHHDMTPLDFFTDHILNIDGIFDDHSHGDDQKPHHPFSSQHQGQFSFAFVIPFFLVWVQTSSQQQTIPNYNPSFRPSDYIKNIFRPPIV